ncbi:Exodeoxyribonuclease VII small subunit [Verrucomicrobium sp. GAS474]|uniref:exodeoxyribonuclease VII small subunit n=1 Tax=Verrucomicrobium sp. GAS474 TaxID=1882831 RepID=UPI00087C6AE0|nr:exodeoxyribonuclease VII small subunit [Verrucomicrobium sp. GAS474]SDT98268.1 Exodeoxyribonuclease VII small subunit [Verrucomicrobium sp. GAS474]
MKAKPSPHDDPTPKFEAALADLERIVTEMEDGELPLDHLIERYEEGIKLVKLCDEKLSEAEQKIEVLTSGKAEKEKTAKEPKSKPAPASGPDEIDPSEEGPSLF